MQAEVPEIELYFSDYYKVNDIVIFGTEDESDGLGTPGYVIKKYLKNQKQYPLSDCQFIFTVYPLSTPFLAEDCQLLRGAMKDNSIAIAVSVIEFYSLPPGWADRLNTYFDMVVVPDQWLVDVYKRDGVTIPIFCIPQGILVQDYITQLPEKEQSDIFTFGSIARNFPHKNVMKMLQAFHDEFGNDNSVQFIFHTKSCFDTNFELFDYIEKNGITNIIICEKNLPREEYLSFIQSLDCYVLISRGEGFSITPREAMALGVPCLLSNNTAHTTICNSGYVSFVECPYLIDSLSFGVMGITVKDFDCDQLDVQKEMRAQYEQRRTYKQRAQEGISWANQYEWKKIVSLYETLFYPQNVILGSKNAIENNCLVTDSVALYEKYKAIKNK